MILFHIPRYLEQMPGYKELDDDEFIYLFITVSNLILIPGTMSIRDDIKTVSHDLAVARLFDKLGVIGSPGDTLYWVGIQQYQRYIESLYEVLSGYLNSYREDFIKKGIYCVGLQYEYNRLFIVLDNLDNYE